MHILYHKQANLIFSSVVAVAAGTLLPHLAGRDRRLMAHKDDVDEDAELTRLKNTVREWRAEAARMGKPLRLPVMPFLLRNIWTGALVLFTVITFSTFFITTVAQVRGCQGLSFDLGTEVSLGNRRHQPRWHLLGCCMLGAVCHHHGGTVSLFQLEMRLLTVLYSCSKNLMVQSLNSTHRQHCRCNVLYMVEQYQRPLQSIETANVNHWSDVVPLTLMITG